MGTDGMTAKFINQFESTDRDPAVIAVNRRFKNPVWSLAGGVIGAR
jgi:hypothetical protein